MGFFVFQVESVLSIFNMVYSSKVLINNSQHRLPSKCVVFICFSRFPGPPRDLPREIPWLRRPFQVGRERPSAGGGAHRRRRGREGRKAVETGIWKETNFKKKMCKKLRIPIFCNIKVPRTINHFPSSCVENCRLPIQLQQKIYVYLNFRSIVPD